MNHSFLHRCRNLVGLSWSSKDDILGFSYRRQIKGVFCGQLVLKVCHCFYVFQWARQGSRREEGVCPMLCCVGVNVHTVKTMARQTSTTLRQRAQLKDLQASDFFRRPVPSLSGGGPIRPKTARMRDELPRRLI